MKLQATVTFKYEMDDDTLALLYDEITVEQGETQRLLQTLTSDYGWDDNFEIVEIGVTTPQPLEEDVCDKEFPV